MKNTQSFALWDNHFYDYWILYTAVLLGSTYVRFTISSLLLHHPLLPNFFLFYPILFYPIVSYLISSYSTFVLSYWGIVSFDLIRWEYEITVTLPNDKLTIDDRSRKLFLNLVIGAKIESSSKPLPRNVPRIKNEKWKVIIESIYLSWREHSLKMIILFYFKMNSVLWNIEVVDI